MNSKPLLRTKIVCTIGPASREPEMLEALIHAGMDVARLNMSHGDLDFHRENIQRIRAISDRLGKPVAILCDLQGPKLRIGIIAADGVQLTSGEALTLTTEPVPITSTDGGEAIPSTPRRIPVQYERLPEAVKPGDHILIDDGLLEFKCNEYLRHRNRNPGNHRRVTAIQQRSEPASCLLIHPGNYRKRSRRPEVCSGRGNRLGSALFCADSR